ncbi:g3550 [Coccomyxa elongata]
MSTPVREEVTFNTNCHFNQQARQQKGVLCRHKGIDAHVRVAPCGFRQQSGLLCQAALREEAMVKGNLDGCHADV